MRAACVTRGTWKFRYKATRETRLNHVRLRRGIIVSHEYYRRKAFSDISSSRKRRAKDQRAQIDRSSRHSIDRWRGILTSHRVRKLKFDYWLTSISRQGDPSVEIKPINARIIRAEVEDVVHLYRYNTKYSQIQINKLSIVSVTFCDHPKWVNASSDDVDLYHFSVSSRRRCTIESREDPGNARYNAHIIIRFFSCLESLHTLSFKAIWTFSSMQLGT